MMKHQWQYVDGSIHRSCLAPSLSAAGSVGPIHNAPETHPFLSSVCGLMDATPDQKKEGCVWERSRKRKVSLRKRGMEEDEKHYYYYSAQYCSRTPAVSLFSLLWMDAAL